ncbi:MAG: crossover junction endodeoxyribonuclease RuvC [Chloroflexi bacterium]|nr:crossover junction endodeoxyribonuclease RuvC [Chloroflexota bacterium]
MLVLGVDPGLNVTGYGVLETTPRGVLLVEGGVVRTGRSSRPLEQRLQLIYQGIAAVLAEFHPEALALEDLYAHRTRPVTAISMAYARGVVCLAAADHQVPVFTYTASQVKSHLTGQGRATKEQVQRMVQVVLRLPEPPRPADVADALAVALYHSDVGCKGWEVGPGGRVISMQTRKALRP